MKRNSKALGLALVAAFAMSAVMASVAQAQTTGPAAITIEGGSGILTGTPEGGGLVLARQNRSFFCNEELVTATVNNGDTTITSVPLQAACEWPGPIANGPATVTMNSCHFTFHLEGHAVEGKEDTWTAIADLRCTTPGDKVQIHIYSNAHNHSTNVVLCTYEFQEQWGLGTIRLSNRAAEGEKTPKDWITADVDLEKITSKRTAGSAAICGGENDSAGTLQGLVEIKGENHEGWPKSITISTHTL